MKIGLFGINFGLCGDADAMVRVARAAEEAELESLWTGEHVVLPDPQAPPSPAAPRTPFLDPSVALAHIAAHTQRIRLGTGIIILPQRNPVELAKELASVDVVSGGRLIFGLGAGYLEPEFRALGANYAERGAVTDEAIDALRALWTQEKPAFSGPLFPLQRDRRASAARAAAAPADRDRRDEPAGRAARGGARQRLVRLLHQPRAHRALARLDPRGDRRGRAPRRASARSRSA